MKTAPDPLELCAQEPIRIPGAIQPHGALVLIRRSDGTVLQQSANLGSVTGVAGGAAPATLADLFGRDFADEINGWLDGEESHYLRRHVLPAGPVDVSGHRAKQGVILEFEPGEADARSDPFYPLLRRFMEQTDGVAEVDRLCGMAARLARELTGFNRVMIYRFDADWNGTVTAESGDGTLPSYLDLRFPASDIPAQARELYRLNRLRLIPDATYAPVPLSPPLCPLDGQPLDMSFAALRSVSPVHLEYMRNMGTAASMSVSIVIDGKLWGLISCHHAGQARVRPQVRAACDFLGRILAQQIAARERAQHIDERLRLKRVETELIAHLARARSFQDGLGTAERQWLALTNATGAAVVTNGAVVTAGAVPGHDHIRRLVEWLHGRGIDRIYATDSLAGDWAEGEALAASASGVLAVPVSRIHASYVLWFRPEVVRTVTWGGDPDKEKSIDESGRLNPRRSFESWKEVVRLRGAPWSEAEVASALDFRSAIINFVLQRAEERAQLTEELQRSNKELESFSYSVSHDLRAPFRHIVGYAQLLSDEEPELKSLSRHYLDGITGAALSAGQLVDDLLHFSQLGRASLAMTRIDMNKIVAEVLRSIPEGQKAVQWEIARLPDAWGDPSLVRQAVFNLVENAVKYSRDQPSPRIVIAGADRPGETVYSVEDNGVGFDMAYADKLFQVFQRLHRQEEFEGTGIGLALTKRIVERHGGSLEARGAVGKGALFSFALPKARKVDDIGNA